MLIFNILLCCNYIVIDGLVPMTNLICLFILILPRLLFKFIIFTLFIFFKVFLMNQLIHQFFLLNNFIIVCFIHNFWIIQTKLFYFNIFLKIVILWFLYFFYLLFDSLFICVRVEFWILRISKCSFCVSKSCWGLSQFCVIKACAFQWWCANHTSLTYPILIDCKFWVYDKLFFVVVK